MVKTQTKNVKSSKENKIKRQFFHFIKVSMSSPEKVRKWGQRVLPNGLILGEVITPETINYKTYRPEFDGLFCERIFGPMKNWECSCGKFRFVRNPGFICDRCGVELTESRVRRYRMGYIELSYPTTHIWYFYSKPSYISLILDVKFETLDKTIYFYVDTNKIFKSDSIKNEEANFLISKLGSDKIYNILKQINLKEKLEQIRVYGINFKHVAGSNAEDEGRPISQRSADSMKYIHGSCGKVSYSLKRLRIFEHFYATNSRPEWMVLYNLPVAPPGLRPMVQLETGKFASSDLNELYRRIIIRNNRLAKLEEIFAPNIIIMNEKRMLQESVDTLIDNGRKGKKIVDLNNKPFKSLSEIIEGKQGRFRQNLLGKRVDYSGRSVIIVGPTLKLHECGIPYEIAVELFQPYLINKYLNLGYAGSLKGAKRIIQNYPLITWKVLEKFLAETPILLNRAPTLHRLGIQAFQPILIAGRAIKLHPLVCPAFNADFDGDQMAIHLPLLNEAKNEAKFLMLSIHNFLSPATGDPILVPSQDMVIGSHYLTTANIKGLKNSNHYFSSLKDVLLALDQEKVELHSSIWVKYPINKLKTNLKEKILSNFSILKYSSMEQIHLDTNGNVISSFIRTTPGRVLFNYIILTNLKIEEK